MITHSLQIVFPNGMILLLRWLGMITAIHLYYKAAMSGREIHDVVSYYVLPKEVNP